MKKYILSFFSLFFAVAFQAAELTTPVNDTEVITTSSEVIRVSKTMTVGETLYVMPSSEMSISTSSIVDQGYLIPNSSSGALSISEQHYSSTIYSAEHTDYNITALKQGTYSFTALVYYKKGTATSSSLCNVVYLITVYEVTKVVIPSSVSIHVGETYTFEPSIIQSQARTQFKWQSSSPSTVSVTDTYYETVGNITYIHSGGTIQGLSVGSSTITCTAKINGVFATCLVTVVPVLAEDLSLNYTEYELEKNETIQLCANILPETTTYTAISWTSSDENIAIVDANGKVKALSSGSCNIIATTTDGSDISRSCTIIVPKENKILLNKASVCYGAQVDFPVFMLNEDFITALQFDLTLPEGVSVGVNEKGKLLVSKTKRCEDHTLSASKQDGSNTYRVLLYSVDMESIDGNSGAVVNMTIDIDEDMVTGEYEISISNINLTATDQTKITPADVTCTLTVRDYIRGDANGDGTVDVTDIVAIANHILGQGSHAVNTYAADVNGDGVIDVTDIVGVANLILNGNSAKARLLVSELMPQ